MDDESTFFAVLLICDNVTSEILLRDSLKRFIFYRSSYYQKGASVRGQQSGGEGMGANTEGHLSKGAIVAVPMRCVNFNE